MHGVGRAIAGALAMLVLLAGSAAAAPRPAASRPFITPTWGVLSSPAGWRVHPVSRTWRVHWGIDIVARAGTPVLASAAGTVQFVGHYGGYGRLVVLQHAGGWQTLYGHLSRALVRPGMVVAQAAVIAQVGSTGISTGPHLHFEVRFRGWPVDPLAALGVRR